MQQVVTKRGSFDWIGLVAWTIKRGSLHRGMTKIESVRRLWKLVN